MVSPKWQLRGCREGHRFTCEPIQYFGNYEGNDGENDGDICHMSAIFSAKFSDQKCPRHYVGDIEIVRNAGHILNDIWMQNLDEIWI